MHHTKTNLTSLIVPLVLFVLFSSACEKSDNKPAENKPANTTAAVTMTPTVAPTPQTPVPASTQPKNGDYPGKGKVTKINNDLGSVELDHQEIVGVMPAMIMEFYVKDKSLLKDIAVGDNVEFTLEYKHPSETIVAIKKVK